MQILSCSFTVTLQDVRQTTSNDLSYLSLLRRSDSQKTLKRQISPIFLSLPLEVKSKRCGFSSPEAGIPGNRRGGGFTCMVLVYTAIGAPLHLLLFPDSPLSLSLSLVLQTAYQKGSVRGQHGSQPGHWDGKRLWKR